jgi:hypothetical protein
VNPVMPEDTAGRSTENLTAEDWRDIYDALIDAAERQHTGPKVDRILALRRKLLQEEDTRALARTKTTTPELLVLSGHGIRFGVPGHYGLFHEAGTFNAAVEAARAKLAAGHARSFVAIRIEAKVIDGIGDGTERELVRFEVYPDRVVQVPVNQGGLSDEQKTKALALPKKGLL